jgi:hypothetical protein
MSDPGAWLVTTAISIPLVILAVFDLDVARELRAADAIQPSIPFLGQIKGVVYGITLAAVIFAILGILSAVLLVTGLRLLPQPLPLILIYIGCIAASVMVWRLRRWIRSQT